MVTRVLELIARPGKSEAVCDAIEFEVRLDCVHCLGSWSW